MNDIALSSLLNLFALFGADSRIDSRKAIDIVEDYLSSTLGLRNPQSYINLYNELRGYYDDFPELDKEQIVEGICSKLRGKISKADQGGLFLRLLEFCSQNAESYNPENHIFRKAAECFDVSDNSFVKYTDFISGKESEDVRVIRLDGEAGILKTLYLKGHNTLLFSYIGNEVVLMNDIAVTSGMYRIWQQSGVLKSKCFKPMYYSDVLRLYEKEDSFEKISMCGRNVNFRYPNSPDIGMHNLSFDLQSGQFVAIMGGSGVGKSTLLSLLNGTLRPQGGSITVNGHDISEPEAKSLIGFVPQDDLLIEELTVYENLWFTAKLCFEGMPDSAIDAKVMSVLKQLGLDQAKDLKVGSPINKFISGGQRKRLNIALELIREPAILFLDEPTSGLSSSDTEKVIGLLKEQSGKGKLVVTNIHQPSSDVYKLFDRLWLLDKGGYPIFDGNPIDAITYFKSAANYADADTSACPVCGNVNPEQVLNIIEENAIDTTGHLTDNRKVTPAQWHEMYLKKKEGLPDPAVSAVPDTDQKRPNRLKQCMIFLKRNICAKVTNLQYVLVTLLEAPVLAGICALLTHYVPDGDSYSVMENSNMVSYFFMAVIVAIFLGMSGSAEEIIRDRALLKREKFLSLSHGSYIWSKIIYMACVCLVQTFLFIVVGNAIMEIHSLLWTWWLILFLSAFLAGLTGLVLSQCMNSVVAIYITIPLLLIPQILLCGLVVDFQDLNPRSKTGNVPIIGDLVPSRWAFEALAVSNFTSNDYEENFYEKDRQKYQALFYNDAFAYEIESRNEMRRDDALNSREEDPENMAVIRNELPRVAEFAGMPPYEGDWSYESLDAYITSVREKLSDIGNRVTLSLDRDVNAYIRQNGRDALRRLKRENYNLQLENVVLNRNTEHFYTVIDGFIVPRCGYIFLTPKSHNGRAPFYSGVKIVGNTVIPTLLFNCLVLVMMSIILIICLCADFPGKLVRKQS